MTTAASPEVAVEALWRTAAIPDRGQRRAAIKQVLEDHWPAVQAHFSTLGDDLTTHDRNWYTDHFTANIYDYIPKDLVARLRAEADAAAGLSWRTAHVKAGNAGAKESAADPPSVPATNGDVQAGPPPKTAAEYLTRLEEAVVGQPRACRCVALAMVDSGPGATMLIGPSGCGKTLIAERAAALARRPFVSCDASALVPAGIVGETLSRVIGRLRASADALGVEPETGVVLYDEVDKQLLGRSVYGAEVAAQMLRVLDGATVEGFKTNRLTILLAGAWSALRSNGANPTVDELGLPVEFAGRIRRVGRVMPLGAEALLGILQNARISPWGKLLARVADDAHAAAIAEVQRKGTGARGLRFICTAVADHLAFTTGGDTGPITAAVVAAALEAQ